jgi:hypothetical protein
MPDSPHVRLRHPDRKRQPHVGESQDPVVTRKGSSGSVGVLLLLVGGLVFFCYIFNLGGIQVLLDSLFSGVDTKLRSHNNEVATNFAAALPYLAVAIGAILLLVVFGILGRAAESLVRIPKRKPAPDPKSKAKLPTPPRPAAEFIRPARLTPQEPTRKPNDTPPATRPSPTKRSDL